MSGWTPVEMGVRSTVARTPVGRVIWPRGRKAKKAKFRTHPVALWLANAVRFVRRRGQLNPPRLRPTTMYAPRANALGMKLWGGFSRYAKDDLEAILASSSFSITERRAAAWYLAEWHNFQDDQEAALSYLQRANALGGTWRIEKPNFLFETNTLLKLGRVAEAEALLSAAAPKHGSDIDFHLLAANVALAKAASGGNAAAGDDARLEHLNRVYIGSDLHPVRKIDAARPLAIDNITAAVPRAVQDGPLISVIMPAHNAAATIGFALRGLTEQTWKSLEILVVDDASTDATREIVISLAGEDDRIKLIGLAQGSGAYGARNKGAELAKGEFLTVHDSDDWSHPQKLEVQVKRILEGDVVASLSYWIRVTRDLHFCEHWRPDDRLVHTNHSSLMVRTDIFRSLGGWDPVRVTGDTELIRRVERKFGKFLLPRVMKGVPLSFALERENALTRAQATHLRTLHFGIRQEYRRALDRWHLAAERSGDFYLSTDPAASRKFPAPQSILSAPQRRSKYAAVFVADLASPRGRLAPLLAAIARLGEREAGIGVFHWPSYEADIEREIDERLARLVDAFKVDMIAAGETVSTEKLIFFTPEVLRHRIDRAPEISFDVMQVVTGVTRENDPSFAAARENLAAMFGTSGEWVPSISERSVP